MASFRPIRRVSLRARSPRTTCAPGVRHADGQPRAFLRYGLFGSSLPRGAAADYRRRLAAGSHRQGGESISRGAPAAPRFQHFAVEHGGRRSRRDCVRRGFSGFRRALLTTSHAMHAPPEFHALFLPPHWRRARFLSRRYFYFVYSPPQLYRLTLMSTLASSWPASHLLLLLFRAFAFAEP